MSRCRPAPIHSLGPAGRSIGNWLRPTTSGRKISRPKTLQVRSVFWKLRVKRLGGRQVWIRVSLRNRLGIQRRVVKGLLVLSHGRRRRFTLLSRCERRLLYGRSRPSAPGFRHSNPEPQLELDSTQSQYLPPSRSWPDLHLSRLVRQGIAPLKPGSPRRTGAWHTASRRVMA